MVGRAGNGLWIDDGGMRNPLVDGPDVGAGLWKLVGAGVDVFACSSDTLVSLICTCAILCPTISTAEEENSP